MTESPANALVGIHRSGLRTYERAETELAIASVLSQIFPRSSSAESRRGPLASLIEPGDVVLLKPNMLRHRHLYSGEWQCLVTHGEIVRAVALLAAQALEGRGRLIIADGPDFHTDFSTLAELMGLADIQSEVLARFGVRVEVLDLRETDSNRRGEVVAENRFSSGDPLGYVDFDLSDRSEFAGYHACGRMYGRTGDLATTRTAHARGRHCYRMARTPIVADVFINLPKMKTHGKTGVSLSLKNVVGIHGDRNYLPHFTMGSAGQGGDECQGGALAGAIRLDLARRIRGGLARTGVGGSLLRFLTRAGQFALAVPRQPLGGGDWHGNDTAWRMVLDLNKILMYGRADGSFAPIPCRRHLTIVDGIVAGDGDGPLAPDPQPVGVLIAGLNPVAVDSVAATLMGFDPARLKTISEAWRVADLPLVDFVPAEVECISNVAEWNVRLEHLGCAPHYEFAAPDGWRGHIELA